MDTSEIVIIQNSTQENIPDTECEEWDVSTTSISNVKQKGIQSAVDIDTLGCIIDVDDIASEEQILTEVEKSDMGTNIVIVADAHPQRLCWCISSENITRVAPAELGGNSSGLESIGRMLEAEHTKSEQCDIDIPDWREVLSQIYENEPTDITLDIEEAMNIYAGIIHTSMVSDGCIITQDTLPDSPKEEVIGYEFDGDIGISQSEVVALPDRIKGGLTKSSVGASQNINEMENGVIYMNSPQGALNIFNLISPTEHIISPIKSTDTTYGHLHLINQDRKTQTPEITTLVGIISHVIANRISTLRNKKELARELTKLRKFEYTITHDIMSPLSVAKGHAQLQKDKTDDNWHANKIFDSVCRMEDIIDSTQRLLQAGENVDKSEKLSVEQVAQNAWDIIRNEDVELTIKSDFEIHADEKQLQTVFENLFKNAIQHGETTSEIVVRKHEPIRTTTRVNERQFSFYVQDDGVGIDPDIRDSIFEKGESTKANEQSSGFGMEIVNTIVTAHDWDISIDDIYDEGTRFKISNVY